MTAAAVHPTKINFGFLVRLRWFMVAGQLVTIAVVEAGMKVPLPLRPLLGIVALEAAVNVAAGVLGRRRTPRAWWLAALMALDTITCTGLLSLTGGPLNPF